MSNLVIHRTRGCKAERESIILGDNLLKAVRYMREQMSILSRGEQSPRRVSGEEAEIHRAQERHSKIASGGAEKKVEGTRERESPPMERIKNISSMLARNIKSLRVLGPRGRKIGKGLLLAYAFGLTAEIGAVWQAKNIYQAEMETRLEFGSQSERLAKGEITRHEAIDELVDRGTFMRFKTDEMASKGEGGIAHLEAVVADQLSNLGFRLAEMSVRGEKTPEVAPNEVVKFGVDIDEQIKTARDPH